MIDGVKIKQLVWHKDSRGKLAEIFRQSEFGICKQVYITTALHGVVKDRDKFHQHAFQEDRFCCIRGKIRLVLVDVREDSGTKDEINELKIGDDNFCIVIIPPGVLHAFQNMGDGEAWVLNCISCEYNKESPDEIRVDNKYWDWDNGRRIKMMG